jgi:predicted cobalt transporter CbtA
VPLTDPEVTMAPRTLLIRGMLVGVAAAALAFLFGRLFGETPIDQAIAFESAHTPPGADEPELVSRAVQSTLGLGTAVLVYGTALGGVFALAFAFAYGRLGTLGIRATSVVVAGFGFTAIYLVPMLKYPANPPAIGNPDTIGPRTTLYFLMIGISVAAVIGATLVARSLTARLDTWNAVLVGLAAFVAVVVVAMLALPAVNEVPADFPATVLWRFRLASAGTQVVLWATFGILFGALTQRRSRRAASSAVHTAAMG